MSGVLKWNVDLEVGVSEGDDFLLSAGQALKVRRLLIAGNAGDDFGYD